MVIATVFLPLIGAILAGALVFFSSPDKAAQGRRDRWSQWLTCGSMIGSALLAIFIFRDVVVQNNAATIELFRWIDSGTLEVSWAFKLDTLSAVMVLTVSVVSALIHWLYAS
jgi:NADH-quinone oxidoreductase subunit L